MNKIGVLFAVGLVFLSLEASAQDAEGCKDHPLFSRLANFQIEKCGQNYNQVNLRTSAEQTMTKEGNVAVLHYLFSGESGANPPSPLQVIKNYENAVLKNGGKKIYSSTEGYQGATFTMNLNNKEYWVAVDNMTPGHPDVCDGYDLTVLETAAMKQEIQAGAMLDEINKKGFIALYINFETGKSDMKPESQKTADQIAEMLKANPALKVSIEGHTDNIGAPESNKILSENRAKAVMAAVVAKGIDQSRLAAKGWGQDKPVGDNKTEEGKAKNRRVEIVKK